MSILTSVIKSDPYMRNYLNRPGVPLTAFPSVNTVRRLRSDCPLHSSQPPPEAPSAAAPPVDLRRAACALAARPRLVPPAAGEHCAAHAALLAARLQQPTVHSIPAFPSPRQATKAFLSSISRYAGVALADENFTRAVFDYMIVPGRVWSTAELAAAAPLQLKSL